MLSDAEHDELILGFFAAASGEVPWRDVLERTADLFGSSATLLGLHRPETMEVLAMESHNYGRDFMAEFFAGEIYAADPRIPHIARIPGGQIYYDEMLYDVAEMARDPWVRASTDALRMTDQMGAKLRLPGDGTATIGLLKTARQGRASGEAVLAFRRLVPQIEQACALGCLIEFQAATQAALLEGMSHRSDGLILLDLYGRPRFMNTAAERVLAEADGLSRRDGEFLCRRPPETRRLRGLVREVLETGRSPGQGGAGQMPVTRPSGRRPYVVRVAPPPRRDAFLSRDSIACVLLIQDLAVPITPAVEGLRAVFGLTHREAQLAAALVATTSLERAAAACGMALNTARNHLYSSFAKAGVASQAEAVQLFGRIGGPFGRR